MTSRSPFKPKLLHDSIHLRQDFSSSPMAVEYPLLKDIAKVFWKS